MTLVTDEERRDGEWEWVLITEPGDPNHPTFVEKRVVERPVEPSFQELDHRHRPRSWRPE